MNKNQLTITTGTKYMCSKILFHNSFLAARITLPNGMLSTLRGKGTETTAEYF